MSSRRLAGLDLLRGVAVVLVMLRHAAPDVFAGAGVVGVVMFFTLSGYLITGVLLTELHGQGRIRYRRFYRRRAARLVPALVVLVIGFVLVSLTVDPLHDRDRLGDTVAVALTWTANLPVGHPSAAMYHLWTLATEEQFYLLWPLLLGLGASRGRLKATLVWGGIAAFAAAAVTVAWLAEAPDLAYALPTSWAVCFVIGGAVRYAGESAATTARRTAPLAVGLLATLSVMPWRGHAWTYLAGGPAVAMATAALLVTIGTWATVAHPLARALVCLGTVSYAAYLWNYPLTMWARASLGTGGGVLAAAGTVLLATASWHLVEKPAHRLLAGRAREPVPADR